MRSERPPRSKPGAFRPRSAARKPSLRLDEPLRVEKTPVQKKVPEAAPLDAICRRYLRGFAHDLKPLIQLGQKGVTDAVIAELDSTIAHHELVKIRLTDEDRAARAEALAAMATRVGAEVVQSIGKVATLYRRNPDKAQFDEMWSGRKGPRVRSSR